MKKVRKINKSIWISSIVLPFVISFVINANAADSKRDQLKSMVDQNSSNFCQKLLGLSDQTKEDVAADLEKKGAENIEIVDVKFPFDAPKDGVNNPTGFRWSTTKSNQIDQDCSGVFEDAKSLVTAAIKKKLGDDKVSLNGIDKMLIFHVFLNTTDIDYENGGLKRIDDVNMDIAMAKALWEKLSDNTKIAMGKVTMLGVNDVTDINDSDKDQSKGRYVVVSVVDKDESNKNFYGVFKRGVKPVVQETVVKEDVAQPELVFKFISEDKPLNNNEYKFDDVVEEVAGLLKDGGKTLVVSVHGDRSLSTPLNKDNERVATKRMIVIKNALKAKIGKNIFKIRREEPSDFQQVDDVNLRKIIVVKIE